MTKFKAYYFLSLLILIFLLLFGCHRFQTFVTVDSNYLDSVISSCYVPQDRVILFADLSTYNLNDIDIKTKSSQSDYFLLSDLLEYDLVKEKKYRGRNFRQIPFKQNKDSLCASIHKAPQPSIDSCGYINKYLIEAKRPDDANPLVYVVTMISESNSDNSCSCDFLDKANFSGICIYSQLDGSNVYCQRYIDGRVFKSELNSVGDNSEIDEYLSVLAPLKTKGDDSISIPGSICIGFRNENLIPAICYGSTGGTGANHNDGSSSGYGNVGNGQTQDNAISDSDMLYPQEDECYLEVVSNMGNEIIFACNGKTYTAGSSIVVSPQLMVQFSEEPSNNEFSYWAGDFSFETTDTFVLDVEEDYKSVAYYNVNRPCLDKATGKANPLTNMSIASSSSWGNYRGGTFGKTRTDQNGNLKQHNGIDLSAEVGTPVHSMFDGVIICIDDMYTDGPNNGYGNQIQIQSTIGGNTIIVQYAHLLSTKPVEEDPFTGNKLSVGSHVFQGQLIGYTGKTGNAFNVPNKHLHLGVKSIDGKWIDPASFINGRIDVENQNNIKKGKIDDIKCI